MTRLRLPAMPLLLFTLLAVGISSPANADWPLGDASATTQHARTLLGLAPAEPLIPITGKIYPEVRYDITYETADNMIIGATYVPTPVRANAPVLILVHAQDSNRSQFDEFAGFLNQQGFSTMAIDLRGFGESREDASGQPVKAEEFTRQANPEEVQLMPFDIIGAVDWLDANQQIRDRGVYVLGTSVGAIVSTVAMIRFADKIDGAVILAPLLNYRGMDLRRVLGNIQGRPILVVSQRGVRTGELATSHIQELNRNARAESIPDMPAPQVITQHPGIRQTILEFLQQIEGAGPPE